MTYLERGSGTIEPRRRTRIQYTHIIIIHKSQYRTANCTYVYVLYVMLISHNRTQTAKRNTKKRKIGCFVLTVAAHSSRSRVLQASQYQHITVVRTVVCVECMYRIHLFLTLRYTRCRVMNKNMDTLQCTNYSYNHESRIIRSSGRDRGHR